MLTIKEIKQYFNNFALCFLFILKALPTSVQGGCHFPKVLKYCLISFIVNITALAETIPRLVV